MKKITTIILAVLFTANLMAQVPNYVPTNGLVAWYPFTGNANDESGNGNNGTINGATLTEDRLGNTNKAYSFDGVNDQMEILNQNNSTNLTISIWLSINSYGSAIQSLDFSTIIMKSNHWASVNGYSMLLNRDINNVNSRGIYLYIAGSAPYIFPFNWQINQWYHLVLTINNGNAELYINNNLINSYSNVAAIPQNNGNLVLANGNTQVPASYLFPGKLDDIGIWNRALTETEITKLYKSNLKNCPLISSITINAQSKQSTITNTIVNYLPNSNKIITDTSQWNYIALTKSGSTGKLYINGILVTNSIFENKPYIWNSLLLGATQNCVSCAPVPNFKGLIDEVRVSNIARSAQSISSYFSSNSPFVSDLNTIGLFNLDTINSGSVLNNQGGTATTYGLPKLSNGKFGKALEFNGSTDYIRWTNSIPVNNMTIEFWIKSSDQSATIAMLEYAYNTGIHLSSSVISNPIHWSTGDTSSSITVDPSEHSYIWVSDGNCKDSIWFNSNQIRVIDTCITKINDTIKVTKHDTIKVTKYDTITTKITKYDTIKVMDTLVINSTLSGISAPNNTNRLIVYPNPAMDHITIDYGVFSKMSGYTMKITNTLGQTVFSSPINQQSSYINLSTWTGKGMYNVQIFDTQNNMIENRKIVLQ
jgi:hypothetical protein